MRYLCIVLSWLCFGAPTTFAQTAVLEGEVTDPQNAAIVAAMVTVSSPGNSFSEVVLSDSAGAFRLSGLEGGDYRVVVTHAGFQRYEETVSLVPEAERSIKVRLEISPFAQNVDVIDVSPMRGSGVGRGQVPASVFVVDGDALRERRAVSLADALYERLGAVTLDETTTNPFQPTLRFRGFTASPLLGLPQGIAVYQNGVRINEPFGDTIQFDLIPQFALANAQLTAGAEPTFGPNALGGALSLRLKNGFDATGFRGELFGGSFERIIGTAELGVRRGSWGLYVGATRFAEAGWRQHSDSDVTQAVVDLAYRKERVDAGVSFTYADTKLNGNGPAPIELLEADRSSVFTYPDTTENRLGFVEGRASVAVSPTWSLQLNGFYRDLERATLNGDEAELGVCDEDDLPPGAPVNALCAGGDDEPGGDAVVDALMPEGFITQADAEGDGAFNRSLTSSASYGSSLQATSSARLAGRANSFILGASLDLAHVEFASNSEVGTLTFDRSVDGSGLFAGIFNEAPDDRFNTALDTQNRSVGLYFSDTWSWNDRVHLTLSGRYNDARITIRDQLGSSLNGDHRFTRFNPAAGVVVELDENTSVFGRYSESNRAPTAAELSCADPAEPCRVPNAFVSDPPLAQPVARSIEAGVRGTGLFEWSATVYRTGIRDDILFVASPQLIGTGYFQNAGDTRRAGLDVDATGRGERVRLDWYASYSLVHATFQSSLVLPGDADVNGVVQVEPGDHLPGIPVHSFKAGGRYSVTDAWDITLEAIGSSSRFFVGDEGNEQEPIGGYGILNFRTAYIISESVELFARVDNLFDAEYATFGILAEVELDLEEAPGADDPRFVSPGAPRSLFMGLRIRF